MMMVQRWHFGKLIILWSWGGVLSVIAFTDFVHAPVTNPPVRHVCELLFILVVLLALSATTWRWLGSKEFGVEK